MLNILPNVMAPVPSRFAALLSGPNPQVVPWLERMEAWSRTLPDDAPKADEDRFYDAATWLGARHLDSLYLKAGPRTWLWSTPETVTITWDNRGLEIEGVAVWAAQYGTFSLPREAFLREVQQFHDSLIAQMAQRVEEVCANWNRPDVHVDFEGLRREQAERASAFTKVLQQKPEPVDWTAVLEAVDYIGSKMKP